LISFITLAFADLETALRFYRVGLGWPTKGIVGQQYEHGDVVFFTMTNGLILALWPASHLQQDTGVGQVTWRNNAVMLAHNVDSQAQVDATLARLIDHGANLIKPPQTTSWGGYAGVFADPDGHLWEIVYNPHITAI